MKKLFLICSLLMAILVGDFSVEAKTTKKKKSKTSSSKIIGKFKEAST